MVRNTYLDLLGLDSGENILLERGLGLDVGVLGTASLWG